MQYRPLGKTGLNLSVISYGAASLGNEYGNATDEARAIRSLHVALEGGVNRLEKNDRNSSIVPLTKKEKGQPVTAGVTRRLQRKQFAL